MQNGNLEEDLANNEPTELEREEEIKDPWKYFKEYKQVAWEVARGEFPNGAERKRKLEEKRLDYATVMHLVDSIVGIDRDIDYWREQMRNDNLEEDLGNAAQDLYGEPTIYESGEECER